MALTLVDYVHRQFPEHRLDAWPRRQSGTHELSANTLVAHVVGTQATSEALRALQDGAEGADVAAVIVRPVEPTLVPHGGEDTNGLFDLPDRRDLGAVVAGIGAGFALGAAAAVWLEIGWVGVLALLVFAVGAGAAVGFIMGGGRFASHRAVSQPHAPDIGVVAVFTDDEREAEELANVLYANDQYDVRIVSEDGAWHAPNN